MLEQVLPFLTAAMLLTLAPGPDIIYVLMQGVTNGKKFGFVTALGLVSGILVHTSLVAFGVSAIIRESENIFLIIKILGAAYLFFLAYKTYKNEPAIQLPTERIRKRALFSLFGKGFLMNVLNPKVTIFFLAFFPGFLWDPEDNTVRQFFVLGFIFMLQALLIFSLVAALAGKVSLWLRQHPSSGKLINWVQIFVYIGIGLFILF